MEKRIDFRLDEETEQNLEVFCKQAGMNKSKAIRSSIELLLRLDFPIFEKLIQFSAGYSFPMWLVVWNCIIDKLAEYDAQKIVWGEAKEPLCPFPYVSEGIMTGKPLYDYLLNVYRAQQIGVKGGVLGKYGKQWTSVQEEPQG